MEIFVYESLNLQEDFREEDYEQYALLSKYPDVRYVFIGVPSHPETEARYCTDQIYMPILSLTLLLELDITYWPRLRNPSKKIIDDFASEKEYLLKKRKYDILRRQGQSAIEPDEPFFYQYVDHNKPFDLTHGGPPKRDYKPEMYEYFVEHCDYFVAGGGDNNFYSYCVDSFFGKHMDVFFKDLESILPPTDCLRFATTAEEFRELLTPPYDEKDWW